MACQHFPYDQTLRLQTGTGEDDIIHLPSGLDRVDCERKEEEEDRNVTHEECLPLASVSNGFTFHLQVRNDVHMNQRRREEFIS